MSDSGSYLAEFYCNGGGYLDAVEVACDYGCENGACDSATAICGNSICEPGESYLSCSDCPKPAQYYSSTFCGNGVCDSDESYLSCSDCAKPVEYYASCGNGRIESGETPENCCIDTGCSPGETCSKILNRCVAEANEIPKEKIANALLKAEELKIKIETLESSASGISSYYSAKGDSRRAGVWSEIAELFKNARINAENIKTEIRNNKDSMTEKKLENIRRLAEVINVQLTSAIDKILEID